MLIEQLCEIYGVEVYILDKPSLNWFIRSIRFVDEDIGNSYKFDISFDNIAAISTKEYNKLVHSELINFLIKNGKIKLLEDNKND